MTSTCSRHTGHSKANAGQYISRRLSMINDSGEKATLSESELRSLQPPVVVLGDPGMGKTSLLARLGSEQGYQFRTAAQFLRRPSGLPEGTVLVLDALDELSAGNDSDPLDRLLTRLAAEGAPPFILSCRAADWRGSTQAKAIADDYGRSARILTLEPLTEAEGIELLAAQLGPHASTEFHSALAQDGLSELLLNPQTLSMLLEIANDGVPSGRADLFQRAAIKMLTEHNEAHAHSATNRLDPDLILDGAGAAMAILLLSGKEGLSSGLQRNAPPQLEHVARIASLPLAAHCEASFRTRLFRTTGAQNNITYCHRTVAEYLGARWIARVADVSEDPHRLAARLLGLIKSGGRVPASLRGLHAWLARHSSFFARQVIATDPYGVMRYGDLGEISTEDAIDVWASLARLSEDDPWFRAGDWQRFAISGLVQKGLGHHLSKLLTDQATSFHLNSLILDLLSGGGCIEEVEATLLAIVSDTTRPYSERIDALLLLPRGQQSTELPAIVLQLCRSGDPHAARLAEEAIAHIGISDFKDADLVDIVFSLCGGYLAEGARQRKNYEDFWSLARAVPVERCARLLDALVSGFAPEDRSTLAKRHDGFGRLVWTLVARQIPALEPAPERLWRWLEAFAGYYGSEPGTKAKISSWLAGNARLRHAIQKEIFATEDGLRSLDQHHGHVGAFSEGLYCQEEDVVPALDALCVSGRCNAHAREAYAAIVRGWARRCDWTPAMSEAAERYADGDAELLTILYPPATSQVSRESTALDEFAELQRKAKRKHERRKRADRMTALANLHDICDGRGLSAPLALCYLGYGRDGGRDLPNIERIGAWVGPDLQPAALEGFEKALQRPLDCNLHQLTERLLTHDDQDDPIWPKVAGLAQRHLDGRGFRLVDEDHLLATLIAKRLSLTISDKQLEGFGDTLEAFALADSARFERFLRALIEPQLPTDRYAVTGTHYLLGGKEHKALRARLLLDWFDRLSGRIGWDDKTLVSALLDVPAVFRAEAEERVDELIAEARPDHDGTVDTAYWTALRIVRDFDVARPALEALTQDPDFIWKVRKAVGHDRFGERKMRPISVERLAWIFERFEPHWPNVEHPSGISSGDRNPWDASEFLGALIFRIAEDTSPTAMTVLHELTLRSSKTYGETLRAARARQRSRASEAIYVPPSIEAVSAALREAPPKSAADIKAIVLQELSRLQERIHGSSTNTVDFFYDSGTPKNEDGCRNALLELLGTGLPFGITWAPEVRMPNGKIADAGFRRGEIRVPMEVKLDRNRGLWTAASEQLDRLYASPDHMASGQGIYLVFWFGRGRHPGASMPAPPAVARPKSAKDLHRALTDQLAYAGDRLTVFVLDATRPRRSDKAS